jgi:hypothetical protein
MVPMLKQIFALPKFLFFYVKTSHSFKQVIDEHVLMVAKKAPLT